LYNKIIENLYVGSIHDAIQFRQDKMDAVILCVLENRPDDEPFKAYHIPIITESGHVHMDQLDHIAFFLETLLDKETECLVHCAAGIERSPLAVAYYLKYSKGISIEEAYQIVKQGRPQTQDRRVWLRK